jgi:hypothetical protein
LVLAVFKINFKHFKKSEKFYTFERKKTMKKLLAVICLSLSTFGYSQEEKQVSFKKNELKGNALLLIAGGLEFTYEHLLNEESGVGVSVFVPFDNDFDTKFSLTPYYRFYFGDKPAAGFFVEGFGMVNTFEYDEDWLFDETPIEFPERQLDFALGFGLGGKWVTKRGFLVEINAGIGRNLFNSQSEDYGHQIVGRGGVTLGYRF